MIENLTIGQYIKIKQIPETDSLMEQNWKFASIIKGISIEEAKKLRISDLNKILKDFDRKAEKQKLRSLENKINHEIKLPSGLYYLVTDYNKLDSSQVMQLVDIFQEHQRNPVMALDLIIAALSVDRRFDFHFVPAVSKYGVPKPRIYKYIYDENKIEEKAAEIRDHIKVKDIWSGFVFFCRLWIYYERATMLFLKEEMNNLIRIVQEDLAKNSDGSQSLKE